MVPAKGAYLAKDIERLRDFYGIPVKPPSVSKASCQNKNFVKLQVLFTNFGIMNLTSV